MARYSKEELDQTKDTNKYEKQESSTWNQVISFLQRTYPEYNDRKEDLPEANGIYRCFTKNGILEKSDGYFLLTDTHLNFYIEYERMQQYAFTSAQIKDITSICANYEKRFNALSFICGLLLSALGIVLATVFAGVLTPFLTFLCYASAGLGLVAMLGSFTFNTIKVYKVNIGTLQGGMTVMGSSRRIISSKMAWSNPMTVVYNAEPDEYNLVNFIEKVNARIALLQERGSFAFDGCLEDLEEYDE